MSTKKDMTGMRFGRLVVLHEDGRNKRGNTKWRCRCDCGNEVTVLGLNLRNGQTTSCGCFRRERSTKHGMHKTRLYHTWNGMLRRTGIHKGANGQERRDYIDRGITVCDEWLVFENFRDWALSHGYSDGLQIDRIDNDKGYCSGNCRWVTSKENSNNRRCTIRLEDGTPLALFCSELGIETRENGGISNQYARIRNAYRTSHKAHPELIQKANNLIALYRKCVEMLKLIAEVKQLRRNLNK